MTHYRPARRRPLLRRLLQRTVWGEHTLDDVPVEFRPFVRWVLPLVYLAYLIGYGGFGTARGGSVVMREALTTTGSTVLSAAIAATSFLTLVALAFKQRRMERIGATALLFSVLIYLTILGAALGGGQSPVGALSATMAFVVIGTWRVLYLSRKIGQENVRRRRGH